MSELTPQQQQFVDAQVASGIFKEPTEVFYKINGDETDIVRVLHGARRWEDLL
jgi:plasmid stabilization system protein ParE